MSKQNKCKGQKNISTMPWSGTHNQHYLAIFKSGYLIWQLGFGQRSVSSEFNGAEKRDTFFNKDIVINKNIQQNCMYEW